MSYVGDIEAATTENDAFRRVVYTGAKSQLVVMALPPGGEIGEETHEHVEQTLFIREGEGVAVLDGVESPLHAGDVLVVTPGTRHNVKNAGATPLRLCTVYAPPNHIDGRVHTTKADADQDHEDEAFGHAT